MNDFATWYYGLDSGLQVFWGCALISSIVFALQSVLTIIGMDNAGSDLDVSFDGDTMDTGGALSLFSMRSLVNFFVGFGWAGVSFYNVFSAKILVFIVAIGVGLLFGYMFFFLRKKLMTFESNGAVDINEAVGKEADVYLRIPAGGTAAGKVQISLRGSVFEYPAVTHDEEIPTGARIRVVEVLDGKTLLVKLL